MIDDTESKRAKGERHGQTAEQPDNNNDNNNNTRPQVLIKFPIIASRCKNPIAAQCVSRGHTLTKQDWAVLVLVTVCIWTGPHAHF